MPLTGLVLGNGSTTGTLLNDVLDTAAVPDNLVPEDQFVPVEEEDPALKSCGTEVVKDHGARVTEVNAAGVGWAGATTDFEYSDGATSALGVAQSTTGKFGSWSAGGTASKEKSVDSTTTVNFATKSTGYWHRKTNFRYKTYKIVCWYGSSYYGGVYMTTRYEARPSNYYGGANSVGVSGLPRTPRDHCAYQEAGSGFTRSTSTAITWTNGVSMAGPIGIDVSSRTGYATDAKVKFNFKAAGWICGTHGDPGGTPRTLVARKYRPTS